MKRRKLHKLQAVGGRRSMMQQAGRQREKGVLCQGRPSFSFIFSFSFFFWFQLIRCELVLIKYPVIYEGKNGVAWIK